MKKNYNLAESSMHIGFMVMLSLISMTFSFTGCTSKPSDPKGEEKLDMTIYENVKFDMSLSQLQAMDVIEGPYEPPALTVIGTESNAQSGKLKKYCGIEFDKAIYFIPKDSLVTIVFETRFDNRDAANEAANNAMWKLHDSYGGSEGRFMDLEVLYSKIVGAKNIILRFNQNSNFMFDPSWSYELRLSVTKSTKEERIEAAKTADVESTMSRDTLAY